MNKKSHYRWIIPAIIVGMILLGIFSWKPSSQINKGAGERRGLELESGDIPSNKNATDRTHPIVELARKSKPVTDDEAAGLENWKRNFPFKPVYHPTMKHDPELYDTNDPSTWDVPDDPQQELAHEFQHVAVSNHGYLGAFHENPLRFTREFEQLYHLLGEFDRNDNAINVAKIFTHLCYYHRAAQHDPNELETKSMPFYNEETGEHGIHQVPVDGKTTWGDEMKSYREGIATVVYSERDWPGKEQMDAQKAWDIADYLIESIPSENLVNIPHMSTFAFNSGHESALKEGEPFLVPKEGFMEDYYENYLKKYQMPIHINREGNPEVLIRDEDGQFYDKATGKLFMPGSKPIEIRPGEPFPR